jgi:serine/threonine protein kinase
MSPEQIRGKPSMDGATSTRIGILAFEMLHGQLPFQGARPGDDDRPAPGQRAAAPQAKPDLPAKLESIIAKSLETEPERRWESMTRSPRRCRVWAG